MANPENYKAPAELNGLRTIALGAGGIALLAMMVGAYFNTEQAIRSWLLGFIFWGGLCFGSLGVLMLQYLTGGAWGIALRRIVEAATRTLPLVIILFVPIAVGVYFGKAYEWTHLPPDDYAMAHRGAFMTSWAWILRSVAYFAIFGLIIHLLNKWSLQQDSAPTVEDSRLILERASRFSGPIMVVYAIVVTFAVVDWIMTLDPHWFSTIWGLLFVAGWGLSTLCFSVVMLNFLMDKTPMDRFLGKKHFHDIGKLMLALTMVWAYFNFSQFLIIWSGNLPEETGWYLTRMKGGWAYIGVGLILFHFAFPYLLLLKRDLKRQGSLLAMIALFILFMRLIDMFYQIGPTPRVDPQGLAKGAFHISWMDLVAPIAFGGIWLWYFFGELMKRPILPANDPYFEEAIQHGQGH